MVDPGQRNPSLKKGGLAVSRTTLHWEMARNKGLLNLLDCHLAISWSWAGYHTSSERGISGLSADLKFLNFFKQIAIFKPYFWVVLASTRWPLHFGLSLCNLLEQIMLPYLKWKGIGIPSIWGIVAWSTTRGYRVTGWLYVYQNRPS